MDRIQAFYRIAFWQVVFMLGVLIDEYLKEGYFFKLSDLWKIGLTHEQIFIVLLATLVLNLTYILKSEIKKIGERRNENS